MWASMPQNCVALDFGPWRIEAHACLSISASDQLGHKELMISALLCTDAADVHPEWCSISLCATLTSPTSMDQT